MWNFGEMKIKFGEKIRKKIMEMWKWAQKKVATLHRKSDSQANRNASDWSDMTAVITY